MLPNLFGEPIPPEHQTQIDRYTRELTDKMEQVALAALADRKRGKLAWSQGKAGFAKNRRTAGGPVDHDLPVLAVTDPNGKLNIARDSGYWMRDDAGKVTKKFKHICWDGCMFPNDVMMKQETWNNILAAMIQVRENHGWKA